MSYDSQWNRPPVDPVSVAAALLGAAGWARVGLTAPDERMRRKAAHELALTIIESAGGEPDFDPRQLVLFG